MNFLTAFKDTSILIPRLQRDYVQGGDESVISPLLDALLWDECDLNYIYGYREGGCFVPVDGQQRLTTLWLLHLYLNARKGKRLETGFCFSAREFADDFCSRLVEKLPTMLSGTHIKDLDKAIEGSNWFIPSWSKNASVRNMLRTLRLIHRKVATGDIDHIVAGIVGEDSRIQFSFLDMNESNGLDDDIYIKMNGRGRPLSQFENLKSWMDHRVESLSLARRWKKNMDNRWTMMFWRNRDRSKKHPEEIDNEQLRCFADLLILFHTKYPHLLLSSVEKSHYKEELCDYLSISSDNSAEEITDRLIEKMRNGGLPPLIWFDRISLMPDQFFRFALTALDRLSALWQDLNETGLYVTDSDTALTYQLAMGDASYARTLPLLYAMIRRSEDSETTLYDWMRTMRNLVLNTEIERKNLPDVMRSVDRLERICRRHDIYCVLAGNGASGILGGFSQRQVNEEISKADALYKDFRQSFAQLENTKFFEGRIECMFRYIPGGAFTPDIFGRYSRLLRNLFDGEGIVRIFDDDNYILRRALMTYPPYYIGMWQNERSEAGCWMFGSGLEDFRSMVRDLKGYDKGRLDSLIALLHEYAPKDFDRKQLRQALGERVESVSSRFETDIELPDDNSFRFYFIHHPGVWSYMAPKICTWRSNFDITLKASRSNNGNRMELRTYSLYLDFRHDKSLQYIFEGWHLDMYQKESSCLYFERKLTIDGESRKIAIDVYFGRRDADGLQRDSEDCYSLELFIRIDSDSDKDQQAATERYISDIYGNSLSPVGLTMTPKGRLTTQGHSRKAIIGLVKSVMDAFRSHGE